MTARLGQITLILTIIAVGYFIYASVQGSVKVGKTISTADTTLETGLVGHWTFDGPDMDWGSTTAEVQDASGNGNDGNAITMTATSSPVGGVMGQGMHFDGVDDYVDVTLTMPDNGTVSLWLKPTGPWYNYNSIFDNSSGANDWEMWIYNDGRIGARISSSGTLLIYDLDGLDGPDNWYNIVYTWEKTGNKILYVNGVQRDSEAVTWTAPGSNFYLGGGNVGNTAGKGPMDDVRIYSRALSVDEITQLYNMGGSKIGKTVNPSNLDTGLVGHWTFDGPDMDWGSTTAEVQDRSGNGNHGNASTTMSAATNVESGVIGQALTFNGTDEYVYVEDTADLKPTTNMTLSSWVKADANIGATNYTYVGKAHAGGYWMYVHMGGGSSCSGISAQAFCSGLYIDGAYRAVQSGVIDLETWYHTVVTYDGTDVLLYLDGVEVDKVTYAGAISQVTKPLCIGADAGNFWCNDYFPGEVDDVRFYDRTLSAAEIKQLYSLGEGKVAKTITPAGLDSGLVGHWTFDGPDVDWGSTTAEVQDISGNGNDGNATTTMTAASSPVGGVIGQALEFDGTTDDIDIGNHAIYDITDDITIAAWVKVGEGNTSGGENIVCKGAGAVFYRMRMSTEINNKLEFRTYGASDEVLRTTNPVDVGEWVNVVMTYDGSDKKIYIDGVLESEEPTTGSMTSSGGAELHFGSCSGNNNFDGTIDDTRIYDRALSDSEIKQLYNLGN